MLRPGHEVLSEILGSTSLGDARGARDLFSPTAVGTAKSHETFRLEPADGLSLPTVIIPDSDDAEDLFATVGTYYQAQAPISAVVHVLSKETVDLFRHGPAMRGVTLGGGRRAFRLACLGAAIGEATLAGLTVQDTGDAASYSACRRTLAFSLCRATLLYEATLQAEVLADRWTRLRKLTGLGVSLASTDIVLLAHAYARDNAKSLKSALERKFSDALQRLATGNDPDGALLVSVLVDLYPGIESHLEGMRGTFDGRMTAFTRSVEVIQSVSHGIRTDEIAVAFVCSRILPGSFEHVGVLARLVEFFPGALVWYGLFSALAKPASAQEVSPGLLGKLERDLLTPFSFEQRPSCDISLEELEVLSRGALRSEVIRPSQHRAILVALLPGVEVYTRFGSDADSVGDRKRHDLENEETHRRVSRLLEEALYMLRRSGGSGRGLPPPGRRPRGDR